MEHFEYNFWQFNKNRSNKIENNEINFDFLTKQHADTVIF